MSIGTFAVVCTSLVLLPGVVGALYIGFHLAWLGIALLWGKKEEE
jgi:hypothetical protein